MKNLIAVLAVVVLAGCFTPAEEPADLKAETQQALTEVTQAIIHGDREAFLARYEVDPNDPPGMVDKLLETQKGGLLSHYGEAAPQIVDLKEEGNGIVSVSTFATKFNAVSPKRVYFRRGEDGQLRWLGVVTSARRDTLIGPSNQVRQATQSACPYPANGETCEAYDIWNQEASQTHAFRGQSQMINVPVGCPTTCWNTSVNPWYYFFNAGAYQWMVTPCTPYGSQCAVNTVKPTYASCTCSSSTVSRAQNYCGWIHAWGWDFWWPNGLGNINAEPWMGASGACPS